MEDLLLTPSRIAFMHQPVRVLAHRICLVSFAQLRGSNQLRQESIIIAHLLCIFIKFYCCLGNSCTLVITTKKPNLRFSKFGLGPEHIQLWAHAYQRVFHCSVDTNNKTKSFNNVLWRYYLPLRQDTIVFVLVQILVEEQSRKFATCELKSSKQVHPKFLCSISNGLHYCYIHSLQFKLESHA